MVNKGVKNELPKIAKPMITGLKSIEQAVTWLNQKHIEHEKKEAVSIETAYPPRVRLIKPTI